MADQVVPQQPYFQVLAGKTKNEPRMIASAWTAHRSRRKMPQGEFASPDEISGDLRRFYE
jgi:hypothetical protein